MRELFKNAKVGERVWDLRFGWGTIIKIKTENENCPIGVRGDEDRYATYTIGGSYTPGENQTLFYNSFKVPEEAYIKPVPDYTVDTLLMTRAEAKNKLFMHAPKMKGMRAYIFEQTIDDIFDYFEGRVCGSCKFQKDGICTNSIVELMNCEKMLIADQFGCNKWEFKDERDTKR